MISLNNLKFLSPHSNTYDNSTHEYINVEVVNEYSALNSTPKPLIFDQVKTCNIVDVCDDYYLSIVRWNIQSNLPVIIPEMITPAVTKYAITLCYPSTTSGTRTFNLLNSRAVQFSPEDFTQIPTLNPSPTRDQVLNDPYYYLNSVDSFLRQLNNAIYYVINTNSSLPGASWQHNPYFNWDSNAGKIVFNIPNSQPVIPTLPPGKDYPAIPALARWTIAVNQPLYNLLSTFRFNIFNNTTPTLFNNPYNTDCFYVLNTDIFQDNVTSPVGEYTPYYQQSSSVVNWCPATALVFTSGTIPLEPQLSGAPDNLNTIDPATQSSVYQQNGITKVLTDFCIPFNSGVEATNSQIYYVPSGEYRLIDLLGNNNLVELSIQVFWRDKYGGLHPMTLNAGCSANILMMLRKKSFNNNTKQL